ncbi:MAG TPA: hypothetical protein VGI97_02510 [Gemmatimonadaceae bacterium]|jgi:hypothetical protein
MTRAMHNLTTGVRRASAIVCVALVGASASAGAQQASSSAAATGMNGNYVAMGQGQDAVAWNPAMLGISGNPHFSLNFLTPSGGAGLSPISWNDMMQYAKTNDSIPSTVRKAWLTSVTGRGGETGSENGSMNWLGLSVWHIALTVSTTETMRMTLNPDMFQALMFGNAGYTGSLQTLDFSGSNMHASVFTTAAASYGYSFGKTAFLGLPVGESSVGITLKYVMGNFMLIGQDAGSTIDANNVNVNFPVVMTNTNDSTGSGGSGNSGGANSVTKGGKGVGMDVGYAWRGDRMTASFVIQNLFNSFTWDVTQLESRPGTATFNTTTNGSNFNSAPFSAAPASLQQAVKNYVFKPAILMGIAYKLNHATTVTGDLHQQFGDDNSILVGPKTQLGGGIEYRGLSFLPLRAGLSYVTGGYSASAGLGIALGPVELGVAGRIGHSDGGNENGFMVSLISIK